jgi:hypothetical protein
MNKFVDNIRHFFTAHPPLAAGIYTYQTPPEAERQYRLHLRLEPNGEGLLIVNARTVLHLNQTAAEYVYHLVQASSEDQAVKAISDRYRVNRESARKDFLDLRERIETLISTPDLDPVTFLDFERRDPYSKELSAPYRIDCALTYKTTAEIHLKLAPTERVRRELLTTEWQTILDKAWSAGIPHVIFTGGEPTLRPDLPELITYAEKLGMVSGLLTDGLRLSETHYLHSLLVSGLDHVLLLLDPSENQCWEALVDMLTEDLFVTVHLTLTPDDLTGYTGLLDRLAEMGVKSISLSASGPELAPSLQAARQYVAQLGMSLDWDLPVPYSTHHPIALELAENTEPQGAGQGWIYIEPDGDVLPAQGVNQVLGNLLTDPWETIWKNCHPA